MQIPATVPPGRNQRGTVSEARGRDNWSKRGQTPAAAMLCTPTETEQVSLLVDWNRRCQVPPRTHLSEGCLCISNDQRKYCRYHRPIVWPSRFWSHRFVASVFNRVCEKDLYERNLRFGPFDSQCFGLWLARGGAAATPRQVPRD